MTPTKKIWRATSRRYLHELLRKFVSWFITISIVCGLNMGGKGYNLRTIFLLAKMGQIFACQPILASTKQYEDCILNHAPQPPVFKPRTIEIVMNQMAEFRSNTLRSLRDIARQKNQPSTLKI